MLVACDSIILRNFVPGFSDIKLFEICGRDIQTTLFRVTWKNVEKNLS